MRTILLFLSVLVFLVKLSAQEKDGTPLSESNESKEVVPGMLTYETSYTGNYCGNLKGGIKKGTVYLGMANIKLGMDTKQAGLWYGGKFFINGAATHGKSPTQNLIGDFQVASNIDAGDHIFLQELWFKQIIKKFEFSIGLLNLNADFAVSENGGMFLNSSFGIPSLISNNVPVPIFPLTAIGTTIRFNISDKTSMLGAVYDGSPIPFESNPYNTNWNLSRNEGALFISEIQWSPVIKSLQGMFKAGYYYHSKLMETNEGTGTYEEVFNRNYGFYLIADQKIWQNRNSNSSLNIFIQFAKSPQNINTHDFYLGGGLNMFGVLDKSGNDALGIAFARSGFHNSIHNHETAIEVYYKTRINEHITIQPDIQYIINPAGTDTILESALAAFFRFDINF